MQQALHGKASRDGSHISALSRFGKVICRQKKWHMMQQATYPGRVNSQALQCSSKAYLSTVGRRASVQNNRYTHNFSDSELSPQGVSLPMACFDSHSFNFTYPSLSFLLCLPLLVQMPMPRRQRSGVSSGCIFIKQGPKQDWSGEKG